MKKLLWILLLCCQISWCNAQSTVIDSIYSGGMYRSYRLYIPAAYNGTTAWPLIFNLHGYTSNAFEEQLYTVFGPIADTAHFLMVYPEGTLYMGQQWWNADFDPSGVDDIAFLSSLLDSLSAAYNIDANSVYSCGMSNGGYMSHTLACALSGRIAAIASVTGSMSTLQYGSCTPGRPVPVMQISGDADPTVNYYGSAGSLAIDTLVKFWVNYDNCNSSPTFTNVANISTTDGCTAEHYVYNGGTSGSSVEFYKIIGGGHTWPGSPYPISGMNTNEDFNASEKIWLFFRKYKLDQLTAINEQDEDRFSVYPNPAIDLLHIEGAGLKKVTICDMTGRTEIISHDSSVDISQLTAGCYVVRVEGKSTRMVRFIKVD